ncbi:RHS repeat-associated core domain-containing protein [Acidobacteria bacterium AH-259-L09]|nr:RHS repeat-associated core domain-containing protein [Acidobacteria bacterium AH-259-L09]
MIHDSNLTQDSTSTPFKDSSGTFEVNEQFFYHADGLGSIMEITDSTAVIARAYVYDSFGKIVQQVGTLSNPFTYTAREFDLETGIFYYRARYYDPSIARLLSEDKFNLANLRLPQVVLDFDPGLPSVADFALKSQPLLQNYYLYVLDNPTNLTDPLGLQCKSFGEAFSDCFNETRQVVAAGAAAFALLDFGIAEAILQVGIGSSLFSTFGTPVTAVIGSGVLATGGVVVAGAGAFALWVGIGIVGECVVEAALISGTCDCN